MTPAAPNPGAPPGSFPAARPGVKEDRGLAGNHFSMGTPGYSTSGWERGGGSGASASATAAPPAAGGALNDDAATLERLAALNLELAEVQRMRAAEQSGAGGGGGQTPSGAAMAGAGYGAGQTQGQTKEVPAAGGSWLPKLWNW